jgi:bifunctional non-homologous end joining protein LigD
MEHPTPHSPATPTGVTPAASTPHDLLARYREMRDFTATPEPDGSAPTEEADAASFVVQKHDASQLHYDFRLEVDGVLKSWSIPKGPSLNPAERRLAMQTEDHPLGYAAFEGMIPEGQYGAGEVIVWDRGRFYPQDKALHRIAAAEANAAASAALAAGELKFELEGEKLGGSWALVRLKGREPNAWLLIKHADAHADRERPVAERAASVLSGRLLTRDTGGPSTAERRRGSVRRSRK